MTRAYLWLLVLSLVTAVSLALAQTPTPTPISGLSPLPNDQRVPKTLLPPGAFDPDTGPSDAIFPPQQMTLRFNHKFHLTEQKQKCTSCHKGATTSQSAQDPLTPQGTTCDDCHGTDHSNLAKVTPGDEDSGQCGFCHVGYRPGDGNKVVPFRIPRPNLVFNHKKHVDRNINCQQCHGAVQELELATRDQMPRMKGCFGCHQMPDSAARGEAKSACETCHIRNGIQEGGKTRTRRCARLGWVFPQAGFHCACKKIRYSRNHSARRFDSRRVRDPGLRQS